MNEIKNIEINKIKTNPHQPRSYFDDDAIRALAISIRENGLVQPITLRESESGYELIAGERRLRACMELGYKQIPAHIMDSDTKKSMIMALIENIQREDLSAIEEAKAYVRIIEANHITQSELAKKLGKSQSGIANKIRLLNLDVNVQNAVEAKLISERHARALLSLNYEKQNEVLNKIIKNKLSVAQTEKLVKPTPRKDHSNTIGYSRNIQIGVNTIRRAVEMVDKSGLVINMEEKEDEKDVKLIIKINK